MKKILACIILVLITVSMFSTFSMIPFAKAQQPASIEFKQPNYAYLGDIETIEVDVINTGTDTLNNLWLGVDLVHKLTFDDEADKEGNSIYGPGYSLYSFVLNEPIDKVSVQIMTKFYGGVMDADGQAKLGVYWTPTGGSEVQKGSDVVVTQLETSYTVKNLITDEVLGSSGTLRIKATVETFDPPFQTSLYTDWAVVTAERRVEATKTPIKPAGGSDYGGIDFGTQQGLALASGTARTFSAIYQFLKSKAYAFDYTYGAYYWDIAVWKDGYPGQLGSSVVTRVAQSFTIPYTVDMTVSLEWEVTPTDTSERGPLFVSQLISGLRKASNYFFGATDGQMCFGGITIYDNKENWNDCDLRIFDSTEQRAQTWTPFGVPRVMEMGRKWIGNGNNGLPPGFVMYDRWDEDQPSANKAAYRTLIHELGHLKLGLLDEYIHGAWEEFLENVFHIQVDMAECFDCLMMWEDSYDEFCNPMNHDPDKDTNQEDVNRKSCWSTIKEKYPWIYVPMAVNPGPEENVGRDIAFESSLLPKPVISSVVHDTSVTPGSTVNIDVTVRNDGQASAWQTIAISFPVNQPFPTKITKLETDLDSYSTYSKGDTVNAMYSTETVTLETHLLEGYSSNWQNGVTHHLKVAVTPSSSGPFAFYVKSVAGLIDVASSWAPNRSWSQFLDQQGEYVFEYLVNVKTPPDVTCVPFHGELEGVPHDAWIGKEIILKGTAHDEDGDSSMVAYKWDFGDGYSTDWISGVNPYIIEAKHTYTGTMADGTTYGPGKYFTAWLYVKDNDGLVGKDSYFIAVRDVSDPKKKLGFEVNIAIDDGLWWLHKNQYRYSSDGIDYGRWHDGSYYTGPTSTAVLAFEIHGHMPIGDKGEDPYVETVQRGLNYIFTRCFTRSISGPSSYCPYGDPDTNGNGIGIDVTGSRPVYEIGMVMMALAASGDPNLVAATGPANVVGRSYFDILTDMVDMCSWGQNEAGSGRGGWRYFWNYGTSDNSVTQWPIIGLEAAETNWGIETPDFVKSELDRWLAYSQNPSGGFGYTSPWQWVNPAKTGAGLCGLAYIDLPPTNTRVVNAIDYLNSRWGTSGQDGYWGNYYSLYAIMKGCKLFHPEIKSIGSHNWYWDDPDGFARYLVNQQWNDGRWPAGSWASYVLDTGWAILTLTPTITFGPPVASAGPDVDNHPPEPVSVKFDASGSYHTDPTKKIVLYEWDFESDGTWDYSGIDIQVEHAYPAYMKADGSIDWDKTAKDYTATLRVTDNSDPALQDTDTSIVHITPPPWKPIADPDGPYEGYEEVTIQLDGSTSYDPESKMYEEGHPWYETIAKYEWDLDNDGQFDDSIEVKPSYTWATEGTYSVGLKVTDSQPSGPGGTLGPLDVDIKYTTVVIRAREPIPDLAEETISDFIQSADLNGDETPDFSWTSGYDISFMSQTLHIAINIQLVGDDPGDTLRQQWEEGIEGIWSNAYDIVDGTHTYPIEVEVNWVDGDSHHVVTVHSGGGRANMLNWFTESDWGAEYQDEIAAHEAGHMLGLYDEYDDGALDPDTLLIITNSLMADLGPTRSWHYEQILEWLETGSGRDLSLAQSPLPPYELDDPISDFSDPFDSTPPETQIVIGDPHYVDASGNTYVTSATSFTLTADDGPDGSGVEATYCRHCNLTHGSDWTGYSDPFYLEGLEDGPYSIDYYSTDIVGNVELTITTNVTLDNTAPEIVVSNPPAAWALQDGVAFMGSIVDSGSSVSSMCFSIREANGGDGIPIGFEDLPVTYNPSTGEWSFSFDTLLVLDGYYVLHIEAEDNLGNENSTIVPYSIRNWAVVELLPSSEDNKAGRTMPVKFALRVAAEVDPNQPFVYNEDLRIDIFDTANPDSILQESYYGDSARDYRISSVLYVTNFKTIKRTPKEYTVAIYRETFDVGSFTFETVK